jgi:MOSC domain-containing protein YiiM
LWSHIGVSSRVTIRHLFVSPGHNFFGRHGHPAGTHGTADLPRVKCRAGLGIEGDRFFGYKTDYRGQVTFFSWERYEAAKRHFDRPDLSASAFRRNVIIDGIDLNALIGVRFSIAGVRFLGTEECRPCYWMDGAVAPGAEAWLKGHGGLRAKILSDGDLAVGETMLAIESLADATLPLLFAAG